MPDEEPENPAPSGPPRYPGTAPPPYPGTPGQPADPWYTPPPQPGQYYPPGSTPPPYSGRDPYGTGPSGYPDGLPYAGWWVRVGGAIIDAVILFVVSLVYLIPAHAFRTTGTMHRARYGFTGGTLVLVILEALYAGILIGVRGQTLGMMAMRIKAVDGTTGALIGFPRALGRDLFERLLAVLFVIPLVVDLLWPLWDPRRQTLHDKVVNSVVIRA